MDRALDPEMLAIALGQHESLPSPEAMSQLLAQAELALLIGSPKISEELIATGWYLHAVASSKYAFRTYGINRQRRAFQVAGHIFDLLLQMPETERFSRLKQTFACQIAYLRSELDPNALAIYRREFAGNLPLEGFIMNFQEAALSCAVSFLGFDINYIYRATQNLQTEIAGLVASWEVEDVFSSPFGAAAGIISATRDLTTFLLYGQEEIRERARTTLQRAILSEPSSDDQISRWVAAHLLNLTDDLGNASIWRTLPTEIPPGVRRAFTVSTPRVLSLWPPQIQLFGTTAEPTINPLSSQVKRGFLSMPTSAGKSLLAQLAVASHLATEQTSVCYVASTRSLCREIRNTLWSRLRYIRANVADELNEGDQFNDPMNPEARVEVMTPERLLYLIRVNSSNVLDQFGMFVFDEAHTVGDLGRGWTLEQCLSFLHYATYSQHHRIILMSAAIGNQAHFVQWIGGNNGTGNVGHFHSDWKGPRRFHAICTTEPDWSNPTEETIRSASFPRRITYPYYTKLDIRIPHAGTIQSLRTTEPAGTLAFRVALDGSRKKDDAHSTPFYRMLIPIVQHLSLSGPVLVIAPTRLETVRMAKAIAESQQPSNQQETRALIDLIEARLGEAHPLSSVIRKGVAYHHGSLPNEIRTAIEESVSQGALKFLVATTTMTEGVNLPVRSVVIAAQGFYSADGYNEFITGSKLLNAIGRAGRATKETEGAIVLALQGTPDSSAFDRLNPDLSEIHVNSTLTMPEALNALAAYEEMQRAEEDAVLTTASSVIADFLSFVWFVAAQLEKGGRQPTLDGISEVLQHTLAWVQMDAETRQRWIASIEPLLGKYNSTEPSSRRRWATVSTSVISASTMEDIARELVGVLHDIDTPSKPLELLELITGGGRLQRILELPEASQRKVYTARAGIRQEVHIPVDSILLDWLKGTELVSLAGDYFSDVSNIEFRFEQLGDFIAGHFETFLPWILGIIIEWVNSLLQENGSNSQLSRAIPSLVRLGVDSFTAASLMSGGIRSRQLALKISRSWESESREGDVRSWLRDMSILEWQSEFEASVSELRNLLEFSRNRVGGVAVDLINEEAATIQVKSDFDDYPEADATLAAIDDSELSPLGIWVNEELVGSIFSRDQADVQNIIDSGLITRQQFSASSNEARLQFQLVNPGTQAAF
ncbi:DEAD/DEAH box helicase [Chloroflexota bacterium]